MAATSAAVPVLQVRDVSRDFGGLLAVDGATFDVSNGITGLIGPNGAGKSTVIGIIAGSIPLRSGTVLFEGHDITGRPPYEIARLGLIRTFQLSSEFANLTVIENLVVAAPEQSGESVWGALFGKRSWGGHERKLAREARQLLRRFGLADKEDEYAGRLSGGQKRLVEIMRALMARPKLLVLDEPLAGVNPTLANRILGYLESLRDEGLTMLMVEHDLAAVGRVCDPVIVMAQGKVVAQGPLSELRKKREVLDAYLIG